MGIEKFPGSGDTGNECVDKESAIHLLEKKERLKEQFTIIAISALQEKYPDTEYEIVNIYIDEEVGNGVVIAKAVSGKMSCIENSEFFVDINQGGDVRKVGPYTKSEELNPTSNPRLTLDELVTLAREQESTLLLFGKNRRRSKKPEDL